MRKVAKEEFLRRAKEKHGEKYDYSKVEFQKTADYITIICPIHGEFTQQVGEHLRGRGCRECAKKSLCKNMEYYIPIFTSLYGDKYDYSEAVYGGSHSKIKVKCNLCGNVFYISPDNLMHGQGCKYCKIDEDRRTLCLEGEIWKDIKGFEGFYMVSNTGRVKSLSRISNNSRYISEEKILSPRVCGTQREYLSVSLHANGKTKQMKIHRLVAEAFVPNPNAYREINHKDENKGNNHVDNLEWCTRSYNVNYGCRSEKQAKHLRKAVVALTSNGQVVREFESIKAAGIWAGVDSSNISRAIRKNNISGTYKWKFSNE